MERGIKLETERLILIPLTYDQVQKYLRNDLSLEMELGVETQPREISPALKEALEETFLPMLADPAKNYLYCTLWTIVLKSENRMVGDLCITGEPKDGEIEIGYGTYTAHQGRGYMVEAVGGLVNWALGQQEVKSVYASTEKTNLASRHILLKNRFNPEPAIGLPEIGSKPWYCYLKGSNKDTPNRCTSYHTNSQKERLVPGVGLNISTRPM